MSRFNYSLRFAFYGFYISFIISFIVRSIAGISISSEYNFEGFFLFIISCTFSVPTLFMLYKCKVHQEKDMGFKDTIDFSKRFLYIIAFCGFFTGLLPEGFKVFIGTLLLISPLFINIMTLKEWKDNRSLLQPYLEGLINRKA